MGKRYLITGGAGFIGSNFAHYLVKERPDSKILVVDKLTYAGNLANLTDIAKRIEFVRADIADSNAMRELFVRFRPEIVVNFAAESHVDRSLVNASPFLQSNIIGTTVLLELSRHSTVERFCQISTDEVYGSINDGSFGENDPLRPSSPYSASKAAADQLAGAYFVSFGVPVVITRSSNNYGEHQYPEKLIPYFVTLALRGKPLPLYGDGENIRDWLYVGDNCTGILTAIERGDVGQIYNIGAGEEHKNIEIARMILDILGKDETLITFVGDRLGHDRRYSIDSSRLKALGWAPRASFADAFRKTIMWYRDHRDWWEKK